HRNFPSQLPIRHATAPPIRLLFCCRKAASLILPSYLHARRSRNFRSAVLGFPPLGFVLQNLEVLGTHVRGHNERLHVRWLPAKPSPHAVTVGRTLSAGAGAITVAPGAQ